MRKSLSIIIVAHKKGKSYLVIKISNWIVFTKIFNQFSMAASDFDGNVRLTRIWSFFYKY